MLNIIPSYHYSPMRWFSWEPVDVDEPSTVILGEKHQQWDMLNYLTLNLYIFIALDAVCSKHSVYSQWRWFSTLEVSGYPVKPHVI